MYVLHMCLYNIYAHTYKRYTYTIDPHYLWILYLQFAYLLRCICIPNTNTHSAFAVTCGHAQ